MNHPNSNSSNPCNSRHHGHQVPHLQQVREELHCRHHGQQVVEAQDQQVEQQVEAQDQQVEPLTASLEL